MSFRAGALLVGFFFKRLNQSIETLLPGGGNAHPRLQRFQRLAEFFNTIGFVLAGKIQIGNKEQFDPGQKVVEPRLEIIAQMNKGTLDVPVRGAHVRIRAADASVAVVHETEQTG